MSKYRLWLFRAIAVVGSTALALALIELLPRVSGVKTSAIVPIVPSKKNSVPANSLTVFDPLLIHRYKPNVRHFDPSAGGDNPLVWQTHFGLPPYAFRIEADAEGFLNPDLPRPISEITSCDAIIIGDSFTVCQRVYDGTPLETLIKRELPNGESWLMLNYGIMGYGPQQELQVLKTYALPKHPRAVIWCFFEGNDLLDVTRFDYRLEDAKKLNEASVVATIVQSAMRKADVDDIVRDLNCWCGTMPDQSRIWFPPYSIEFDADYVRGWPTFESCLTEAKQLCDKQHAKLLLLYIPSKFHVYRETVSFPPKSACLLWKPNDVPGQVRDLCQRLNIDFRDCTAALQQPVVAGTDTFYRNDSHWNATGSAIGAKIVADWLAGHNGVD